MAGISSSVASAPSCRDGVMMAHRHHDVGPEGFLERVDQRPIGQRLLDVVGGDDAHGRMRSSVRRRAIGEPRRVGPVRRRVAPSRSSLVFSVSISRRKRGDVENRAAARPGDSRDWRSHAATPPMMTPSMTRMKISTKSGTLTDAAGCGLAERIERHRHDLAVGDREHQDQDRERDENEPEDELAEHWTFRWSPLRGTPERLLERAPRNPDV